MTEAIIEFFRNLFNNDYLTTFFIALLPIVELRGAVPVAIETGLAWWQAFGLAYLGSSIVAPFLLLLLKPILELLKKVKFFNRFATAVESMFQDKAKSIALKAGGSDSARKEEWIKLIGVYTFVALPIPLTGVWTGTAVAVFLGVKFWKGLGAILLGNLTAGAIVTLLSVFLSPYLDIILTVFFVLVLLLLALFIAKIVIRMVKSKRAEKSEAEKLGASSAKTDGDSAVDENDDNQGPDADGGDNGGEPTIIYGNGMKEKPKDEEAESDSERRKSGVEPNENESED